MRSPPASKVIATRTYSGPPLSLCGQPTITFSNGGVAISFLSSTFDSITSIITILLNDSAAAVKGTYSVDAVFSAPGAFTFSLGLNLTVYDGCTTSTFPSAPVVSPT